MYEYFFPYLQIYHQFIKLFTILYIVYFMKPDHNCYYLQTTSYYKATDDLLTFLKRQTS